MNGETPVARNEIVPLLLVLSLLTCTAAAPSQAAETIKIGASRLISYGVIPIAIDKGYFAAEGLDPDLILFDAAQPIAVAVVSGGADFGVSGLSAEFFNLAAQGQLRLLASMGAERPGFHNLVFLASNRAYAAGLTSLKDLPSHSVAITQIGTSLHLSLGRAAEKFGFDIASVRVLALQSNTNVIAALTGGQADAAVMPTTSSLPAIAHGDIKLLAWAGDAAMGMQGSAAFTATGTIAARHDTVARFLRAYRRAARDYHDAFAGANEERRDGAGAPGDVAILAKFTGVAPEQIGAGLPWADPEGRLDLQDIQRQIDWYHAQNMLKSDVKAGDIIDIQDARLLPQR